ncbi:hypothetical protein [Xanthomonas phage JGB6]|nr:hypothetical protein [Xanthomonas phage JGB6]
MSNGIEFGELNIQNFGAIKSGKIDLHQRGLVAIEGVIKGDPAAASNGAGKSSIVDALSWCFYGVTARGVTGDLIVNTKAGKDTLVTQYIAVDGVQYRVTRARKHSKFKNRLTLEVWNELEMEWVSNTQGTDKLT